MEIYNTKDAKITYHTENNILVQTINDYLNSNSLREFQTEFIKICDKLKVSKIISDAKQQKIIQHEDLEWMKYFIIPEMINNGVEYFAIVIPESPFGKLAMKSFADAANEITVKLFEDLLSAEEWILNSEL